MRDLGKILLVVGLVVAALGAVLTLGSRLPLKLGRLPGDLVFKRDNLTLYIPVATSILLSILLTLLFWLLKRR
ncbi:MAG: DUF2905 domain-containing protein [Candidatus Latescibacterota bacterium]|nr:MAG: DUF2905 domain-containing protein [Candidatus Latescibacterota bacterium]